MLDRPSRRRRFSRVKRPCVAALAALLLAAASSPQVGEVQRIPPDQARAVLGEMVSDQDGKEIGRLSTPVCDRQTWTFAADGTVTLRDDRPS